MQLSSPNKHSHRLILERSFEELDDFKEKLKIWENKELQSNPDNKSNINNTKQKFINYFQYQLGILSLAGFNLHSIPPEIGHLKGLVKIDLSGNEIKELPIEIFQITDLEILDLSANLLSDLPIDEVNNLKKLRILNISNNQFEKDFDFKLPNTSIILENPHSLNNFFLLLEFDAKFTENEKVSDYKKVLDNSIFKDSQDSLSPQIYKDLLSRIKEMNLYFLLSKLPEIHSDDQKLISTLSKALNRFLYESASQKKSNQDQKQIIARELLTICSQIYEKKDDLIFMHQLKKIVTEDIDIGHEDNITLMIFNLKNLCNKVNFDQLTSGVKFEILFKYFKQQLIFQYISKFAKECEKKCIAIKMSSDPDGIICKISLNFLRILNEKFGKKLSLNLPSVIDQANGKIEEYQPSYEIISNFEEIISDNKKLCDVLAIQLSEEIYDHKAINISEISNFEFIKKTKEKVDEVYKSKIEDLKKLITIETHLEKIIIRNLQSFPKVEFAKLIFDKFLELSKNKQPNLVIDTEQIKRNFDQAYRKSVGEPTTMLSARNSNRDSYDRIQPSAQEESMEPQSSPKTRSSIAKCFSKCLSVFFRS